ncbi:MAG: DUF2442 domain-containing protein [Bacteroidota bacterium]
MRRHVHISTSDGTAKIWLEPTIALCEFYNLSSSELTEITKIVENTMMNSSISGTAISACSITNINELGFWILVDEKEYFVIFEHYPGFKDASVRKILNVHFSPPEQLYWKDLDIDIELPALTNPEQFPLIFRK